MFWIIVLIFIAAVFIGWNLPQPEFARRFPTPCPRCGHRLDCASHPGDDAAPTEGDFTICIKCQEVLRFYLDDAQDLRVRKVTEEDILEAPLDQLARFQWLLSQIKDQAKRRSQARAKCKQKRKTRSR